MNIEIANRLVELRKKSGLSQEELADKLGLSRQAVSKWERAESSPDTDNLICLAKLYNVSLDDLLNTDEPVEEIVRNVKEAEEEEGESNEEIPEEEKPSKIEIIIDSTTAFLCLIIYLVFGFLTDYGWRNCWVIFLLIPIIPSVCNAIRHKKPTDFLYPVFVTMIYLFIGMFFSIWHPTWVLFLTIPVFYGILEPIEKANKMRINSD